MRTEVEKKNIQKIADFPNKTLLIVDDDNPLRDRLARAMEKKGFNVIQAESVKKGISEAQNSPPAFAVVDLRLGDGSGLEVVKEIQKLKKDSRVVMLTGYGNIPTAVAAVKAGAIDYIPKPAVLAMIAMPFTYSISNGIALAFVSYAAIKICTGKFNETSPAIWVIAVLSVISFMVA